jgi:hypothetical protein
MLFFIKFEIKWQFFLFFEKLLKIFVKIKYLIELYIS